MKSAASRLALAGPWVGLIRPSKLWRMASTDVNAALLDQAVVSLANFLGNVVLARALGLSGFGIYSLAWMGVLFLNGLQIAAITSPMMSFAPKQEAGALRSYYGALAVQAIGCALVTGVLLFSGGMLVSGLQSPGIGSALALPLAVAGMSFQLQDFARRLFFVTARPGRALCSDVVSYGGQLLLVTSLAFADILSTERALWCSAITSCLGSCFLVSGGLSVRPSRRFVVGVWRQHWPVGKWLTGSALLQWFSGNQLFTVAAAATVGVAGAGAMKAAQNIMGVLHILFQGLENVLPTEAARRLQARGVPGLLSYLQRLSLFAGIATGMVVLAASLFPELWLRLLYGEEIIGYAFVLRWYALVYVLVFVGTPLRACLRALEATQPIFWSTVLAMAFSIATAHLLTSRWGLNGAMAGIAMSFLIMQTTLWRGALRQLRQDSIAVASWRRK